MNRDQRIVQDALTQAMPDPGEEGLIVVGWVVVAEVVGADGGRSLRRLFSEDLVPWQRDGYLHEALYGRDWGDNPNADYNVEEDADGGA